MVTRRRSVLLAGAGALAVLAIAGALSTTGTAPPTGKADAASTSARGGTTAPGAAPPAYVRSAEGILVRPDRLTRIEDFSRVGVFAPDSGIAVANLTVRPGQYTVRYDFEARLDTAYQRLDLRCGVVDANGTRSFLIDDPRPVRSGSGWGAYLVESTFSLPDITLGIRCFPTSTGFSSVSFRDVTLSVTTIPY